MGLWIDLILSIDPAAKLGKPSSVGHVDDLSHELDIVLPDDLRSILLETGSVYACNGSCTIWPTEDILRQNRAYRNKEEYGDLYMPFNHLLLIGDDGVGNMYAYPINGNGIIGKPDIYFWDHETDERLWKAKSLHDLFARIMGGSR